MYIYIYITVFIVDGYLGYFISCMIVLLILLIITVTLVIFIITIIIKIAIMIIIKIVNDNERICKVNQKKLYIYILLSLLFILLRKCFMILYLQVLRSFVIRPKESSRLFQISSAM